ncbi:MAG: agmatinase [Bacteroidetes bacterium]|nr:agmatinase [Bacteroidota bacterium]
MLILPKKSALKFYSTDKNFLGIEHPELFDYKTSKAVIQLLPYEHTSSYLSGSDKGPKAILKASHYVEFYDEELDQETYLNIGIASQKELDFEGKVDKDAVALIEKNTKYHLDHGKFVISFGAEHTVTYGIFKAFHKKKKGVSILQIDAHSDLRKAYQGNPYSHASVMARIHELGVQIAQVGIRAQCIEEAELIKNSPNILTFYGHQLQAGKNYIDRILEHLTDEVYITIDADGFDPSIVPAVGTAEPGGLQWYETLELLKAVATKKKVVGFDIVECAPIKGQIRSEYLLAQLAYKLLGYCSLNPVTFANS